MANVPSSRFSSGHQIGTGLGSEGDDKMLGRDPTRVGLCGPTFGVDGQDLLLDEADTLVV
jgi:hypothetical protein